MVENRALFNVIGDHCQLPDHLLWMRFTVCYKISQKLFAAA